MIGTRSAIAFENVESLRRSLRSLGEEQNFVPELELSRFQNSLRGTIDDAEALRLLIAIRKLGIPELNAEVDTFAQDIADVAAATNEDFDRIFRTVQRFITRGTFERIQEFLPSLDEDEVRAATDGLDAVQARSVRAQLAIRALNSEAESTGNQFRQNLTPAADEMRRFEASAANANRAFGELVQNWAVLARQRLRGPLDDITAIIDRLQGRGTVSERDIIGRLFGLSPDEYQNFLSLLGQQQTPETRRRIAGFTGQGLIGADAQLDDGGFDTARRFGEVIFQIQRVNQASIDAFTQGLPRGFITAAWHTRGRTPGRRKSLRIDCSHGTAKACRRKE